MEPLEMEIYVGQSDLRPFLDSDRFVKTFSENTRSMNLEYSVERFQRMKNCHDDVQNVLENREVCPSNFFIQILNCCVCPDFAYFCPSDLTCCSENMIPANFMFETLLEACPRKSIRIPCDVIKYTPIMTSFTPYEPNKRQPVTELRITIPDLTTVPSFEEYYEKTIAQTISDAGGILGFFLGGSIMGVIHLFYFCIGQKFTDNNDETTDEKASMV